jgi:hypothetical protein
VCGPRNQISSSRDSIHPAEAMSIPRMVGLILLIEVVYGTALAVAVPHGTGAVAIAMAATFLLATLVTRRVGGYEPMTANFKTP